MRLCFHELIKTKKIDNRELTLEDHKEKFTEESAEVIEALHHYITEPSKKNLINLIGEMFDVIQMLITIRQAIKRKNINYNDIELESYVEHIDKLDCRGWTTGKVFEVDINE